MAAQVPCDDGPMREREFWQLLEQVFGRAYGRALSRDLRLDVVGDMTAAEAIEAGVEPRIVWHALCDAMQVPDAKRWGKGGTHLAPPRPS